MRDSAAAALGIKLTSQEVKHGREGGPVAGAHARVETAGEIASRISATRVVLLGPLGLLARKRQDKREIYLTVEGDGFEFVVELKPKQGASARKVASKINTFAQNAPDLPATAAPAPTAPVEPPPPPQSVPAQWAADPHGRHELRYWDGATWTEHVSNSGTTSTDPTS